MRKHLSPKLKHCKGSEWQFSTERSVPKESWRHTQGHTRIKFSRFPRCLCFSIFPNHKPADSSEVSTSWSPSHAFQLPTGKREFGLFGPQWQLRNPTALQLSQWHQSTPEPSGGLHRCHWLNWKMAGLHSCQRTLIWPVVFAFLMHGNQRSQVDCHTHKQAEFVGMTI